MTVKGVPSNHPGKISECIYLHGMFESMNKSDFCVVEGLVLPPTDEEYGIHDVTVIINELQYPGKLYLWKRANLWAGLVVSVDDPEYMEDAEKKYNNKEEDI